MYIYPLPLEPLSPPSHPSRSPESTWPSSPCYTAASHCFTHDSICVSVHLSVHPIPSFPCCVHKALLQVCVHVPALQMGSSGPFSGFCAAIHRVAKSRTRLSDWTQLIWYLFFSFWLTSLCIRGSSFIHLPKLTQLPSFLSLSNIPLYICTTTSLSIHLSTDI